MTITIERVHNAGLWRSTWVFWYDDRCHGLILDTFAGEARATRRHKFKATAMYHRLSHRHSQVKTLALTDVPIFKSVLDEAREQFMARLTITGLQP